MEQRKRGFEEDINETAPHPDTEIMFLRTSLSFTFSFLGYIKGVGIIKYFTIQCSQDKERRITMMSTLRHMAG